MATTYTNLKSALTFACHERPSPPAKRRRYDAASRAEALRLASESRSTQAAAINPKRLYKWQKEAFTPVTAARGAELDLATAAELYQLRVPTGGRRRNWRF